MSPQAPPANFILWEKNTLWGVHMNNDIFIIKVLDKASNFLSENQITDLRNVLEQQLNNYELQTKVTTLTVVNSMYDKIAVFLASKKLDGRSIQTIESYQRCLIRFSQCIQKDVSEVTAMDVRMFLAMFSRNEVKNTTLATNISILKSFFGWLHNEELISKNPMCKIPTTKVEKHLRKPLTLSLSDLQAILSKFMRNWIMRQCGIRIKNIILPKRQGDRIAIHSNKNISINRRS